MTLLNSQKSKYIKQFLAFFIFPVFFLFNGNSNLSGIDVDRVVIWGHKLGTHTHSYIHYGFYKAFAELGYPTYWFDDHDDVSGFDFSNSIFITEGQVDKNIPLLDGCFYMLHNISEAEKYKRAIHPRYKITFQVYTDDVLSIPNTVQTSPFIYYDLMGGCIYMPWATDLLPHEIDAVKQKLPMRNPEPIAAWIGTIGDGLFGNIHQLNPFIQACLENGITFFQKGNVAPEENLNLILTSYMAPAIVGQWQCEKGYIPCRIFKNISYGKIGITNSRHVYEILERKIVYNPDTYQLFFDAKKRMETLALEDVYELMDIVKKKHTYLNRIKDLLDFVELNYQHKN